MENGFCCSWWPGLVSQRPPTMKAPLPDPQGEGLCSHCGAPVQSGQKFCPRCGASSTPSQKRGFRFWVEFVLLLGLCVGLGLMGTCSTIVLGSQLISTPRYYTLSSVLFFVPFILVPLVACGFLARALVRRWRGR